jgi:hypothetical protein
MRLLRSVLGNKRHVQNEDSSKALDFAWQIHAAVSQWSGRVDTKSSIVLTLELAILGAITAFSKGKNCCHSFQVFLCFRIELGLSCWLAQLCLRDS